MTLRTCFVLASAFAALVTVQPVSAQAPETILVNGKILAVDESFSTYEALAIRGGRVAALGNTAAMRAMAGPNTRVIDVGGRTVVPGLIDSHMHAIRAARTYGYEVSWIGVRSLREAVARIRDAAREKAPGSWLIVAGGWDPLQFEEKRLPTQAELTEAAPNNPVYIQLGYGWAMLTPKAHEMLGFRSDADLPNAGKLEKDASGKPTGAVVGGGPAIIALFDKLPLPTFDQEVEDTKAFFRELNRLGMTGVSDPGGNNLAPPGGYQALFKVWREGDLTVRVAYSFSRQTAGREFEELKEFTGMTPMGFGDDMLHFNGIGEQITSAINNNDTPTEAEKEAYYQIVRWAAEMGMTTTTHWPNDSSVGQLLDIFDRVNREFPIAPLRWSIAHLNDASEPTMRRMKELGVGWTMQDAMYFDGDAFLERRGEAAARRTPPVVTATEIGVHVGAGTDAHRVASYNPFTALQWLLDGKTVSGVAMRGPDEIPSRETALRLYTTGSAWFSHDDDVRGSLEPGKFADLAVLTSDYMTTPVERIGELESMLTMVGGKVVYAAGPFAQWEGK